MKVSPEPVVSAYVHKSMPACCRASVLAFAAVDRYMGGGEPGDEIDCPCGNTLIYDWRGWRVETSGEREVGSHDTYGLVSPGCGRHVPKLRHSHSGFSQDWGSRA